MERAVWSCRCFFEAGQDVGWDQRRFAAPAHQQFSTFPDGGPALELSWSHPTLKQAMALLNGPLNGDDPTASTNEAAGDDHCCSSPAFVFGSLFTAERHRHGSQFAQPPAPQAALGAAQPAWAHGSVGQQVCTATRRQTVRGTQTIFVS